MQRAFDINHWQKMNKNVAADVKEWRKNSDYSRRDIDIPAEA